MDKEELSSAQLWVELLTLSSSEANFDDDRAAELVGVLNRRGEAEVVALALPLLDDANPLRRQISAWLLGQHGYEAGRPFAARVLPELARAARAEQDAETRGVLVTAIGHADDPVWVEELLTYALDPYPPVREAVAGALPIMFAGADMSQPAIEALVKLSTDPDPHVRDWATTGLGSQTEQDTEQIRAALRARLDDDEGGEDAATSGEAALGLALRHDAAVLPYLLRWLAAPEQVGNLTVEAAGALGATRLLPHLYALRDADWHLTDSRPQVLTDAIIALEQPLNPGQEDGTQH